MAKDKEPSEPLTGIATQTAEQITQRTQEAMESCFKWFQATMSDSPWGNTDLNKKLVSYATENVGAAFGYVQKLGQAKNLEDVVTIQTEFVRAQTNAFNKHAAEIGEIYTKVATAATRTPVGMTT